MNLQMIGLAMNCKRKTCHLCNPHPNALWRLLFAQFYADCASRLMLKRVEPIIKEALGD